jgi:hypothetical protein
MYISSSTQTYAKLQVIHTYRLVNIYACIHANTHPHTQEETIAQQSEEIHCIHLEHAEDVRLVKLKLEQEFEELMQSAKIEWKRETERKIAAVRLEEVCMHACVYMCNAYWS